MTEDSLYQAGAHIAASVGVDHPLYRAWLTAMGDQLSRRGGPTNPWLAISDANRKFVASLYPRTCILTEDGTYRLVEPVDISA